MICAVISAVKKVINKSSALKIEEEELAVIVEEETTEEIDLDLQVDLAEVDQVLEIDRGDTSVDHPVDQDRALVIPQEVLVEIIEIPETTKTRKMMKSRKNKF